MKRTVLLLALVLVMAGCGAAEKQEANASGNEIETTTTSATPVAAKVTVDPKPQQTVKPCGSEGQPDFGVSVNPSTSCPFAMSVVETYVREDWEPNAPKTATVSAYSPVTHQTYSMTCASIPKEAIGCKGGNDAYLTFLVVAGTAISVKEPEAHSTESKDEVGSSSHAGDAAFCEEHHCIGNFTTEGGTVVECADGTFSHAGGIYGACSYHGGEAGGGGGQYSEGEEEGESSSE